jgi:hypothetical protein
VPDPTVPPADVACRVDGCGQPATARWTVRLTDPSGLTLAPEQVDYCDPHDPARPTTTTYPDRIVEDGHGGRWMAHGTACDLKVVEPGKVACTCT